MDELKVSNDVVVEVSEPAVPKAEEVVVNNVESVTEEVEETSIQVSSDEVPSETILESKQESDEEKQIEKEPFVVKAEEPSLPSTNAEEKEEHTPSEAPLIEVEPEAQNVEVPTFDNGDSVDQDLIQPSEFVNGTSATEPEKQLPEPKVEIQKDAENEDPVKQVLNTNGGFHSSNSSPEFGKKDVSSQNTLNHLMMFRLLWNPYKAELLSALLKKWSKTEKADVKEWLPFCPRTVTLLLHLLL